MQVNLPPSHFLITGGAGFIGSHLACALATLGHRVTVLDNLSNGNLQNLSSLQDKICFVRGDVCCADEVAHACKGVDYILHHAALGSVAESVAQPEETAHINITGTQHVLEAARQNGVKRVVFASSAAVYGTRPDYPYKESTPPDCQSPYAHSKQAATELCQRYTKEYGVDTVILRYFNVFGPRQNPHASYAAVIAKFMQRARENKPLEIEWDGLQGRDFVSVHDVVQANLLAVAHGVAGEIYNVASGHTYTLLELVSMIEKVTGRSLERVFRPKRPGDVHESSADISKIRALGFEPQITLEAGLHEMWTK